MQFMVQQQRHREVQGLAARAKGTWEVQGTWGSPAVHPLHPCCCADGGPGQAPSPQFPICHMVVLMGSSGGLEENVCEVLSVVLHLIITGSVNTGELSGQAFLVVREVVAGWAGFGEPGGAGSGVWSEDGSPLHHMWRQSAIHQLALCCRAESSARSPGSLLPANAHDPVCHH